MSDVSDRDEGEGTQREGLHLAWAEGGLGQQRRVGLYWKDRVGTEASGIGNGKFSGIKA